MNLTEFLKKINLKKIYFSSGYRNSRLLSALEEFEIYHGFLDQSLAFQALGETKVTDTPCVVCVTSGSAVAQTLPAVIEAYFSNEKLIVLSADRARRLSQTAAPQMIDQADILKNHVRSHFSGTLEEFNMADLKESYPMHVNIEFEENITKKIEVDHEESHILFWISKLKNKENISKLKETLKNEYIHVYQEVESPFYSNKFKNEILYEHQLIKEIEKFKIIVHFGATPNAKSWRDIDFREIDLFHILETEFKGSEKGSIISFNELDEILSENEFTNTEIPDYSVSELISKFPNSEIDVLNKIINQIDQIESYMLIGNSMPIRYLKFFKPQKIKIISNRGANGIDGLISTAIGMASSLKDQTIHLIIGDLSFYYEFSSAIADQIPNNLNIHMINNNGGRIFERVCEQKEIINEHQLKFNKHSQITEYLVDNDQTNKFWSKYLEFYE